MKRYEIASKAGQCMGVYEGETPAQALAAMHRDAGYVVSVDADDRVTFAYDSDRALCGDVSDWDITDAE